MFYFRKYKITLRLYEFMNYLHVFRNFEMSIAIIRNIISEIRETILKIRDINYCGYKKYYFEITR